MKKYKVQKKYKENDILYPLFKNVLEKYPNIQHEKLEKMKLANEKFSVNINGIVVNNKTKVIQNYRIQNKYKIIQISLGYTTKTKKVCLKIGLHRILFLTFGNNILSNYYKLHIDHINDTLLDNENCFINTLENLQMLEASENAAKSNKSGNINNNNKQKIPIISINLKDNTIKKHSSISEAARELNLSQSKISENISNKKRRPTVKGYNFKIDPNFEKTQQCFPNEEFKKITKGSNYEVSNFGRVKNANGQIFLGSVDKNNYCLITPYVNKKLKRMLIHRCVALVFIKPGNEKYIVSHKDGIRNHNCIENLEILNHKRNKNINIDNNICNFCKFNRKLKSFV